MAERKSPTAVLREGPRALSDDQVREIEDSALTEVLHVDIDDLLEFFKAIYFFVESLAVVGSVPGVFPAALR